MQQDPSSLFGQRTYMRTRINGAGKGITFTTFNIRNVLDLSSLQLPVTPPSSDDITVIEVFLLS